MVFGLSFEQLFTYGTLGVTLAHKLVDVAKWFASQTKSTEDDKVVGKVASVLDQISTAMGYLPALRLKGK
jgi:hypothetical protein